VGIDAGLYLYDVIIKKFMFVISFLGEFLFLVVISSQVPCSAVTLLVRQLDGGPACE